METSPYTIPFKVDKRHFLYNSLSNALLEVDMSCYKLFDSKNNRDLSDLSEEKELFDILVDKQFVTSNALDQKLSYVASIQKLRSISDKFHLTIAPTMNCPFSCPYCFETVKQKGDMSEDVQQGIVAYLNTLQKMPDYHITWFGGEPLMAIDIIDQLYSKLEDGYKPPYQSNMITTGYHIDEHTISILKRINCTELQITLDGLPQTHNKIKRNKTIQNPFLETLDGMKKLLEDGSFKVTIRVNITKQNSKEFLPLLSLLIKELGSSSDWSCSPGLVLSRGVLEKQTEQENDLISIDETVSFAFEAFANNGYRCSWMEYPSNLINECAVRNPLSLTLDAQGYMYKCWETIGQREWAYGHISKCGKIEEFNPVMLNRFLYGADHLSDPTCADCSVHPICHGGCPYNWILNAFEGTNRNLCSPYKKSIKRILKHYIRESEEGNTHSQ